MTDTPIPGIRIEGNVLTQPDPCGDALKDSIAALEAENARLRDANAAVLDALFDAIALIGHAMPMETTALIGGERMIARDVWQRGHDIMFGNYMLDSLSGIG